MRIACDHVFLVAIISLVYHNDLESFVRRYNAPTPQRQCLLWIILAIDVMTSISIHFVLKNLRGRRYEFLTGEAKSLCRVHSENSSLESFQGNVFNAET
jgi:hypothetical protein